MSYKNHPLVIAAMESIDVAKSLSALDEVRVQYLGKKGELKTLQAVLKSLSDDEKVEFGKMLNGVKQEIQEFLRHKKALIEAYELVGPDIKAIDVTLPGVRALPGHRHPLMATMDEVKSILVGLGFRYDDYPEVESEFYNFDALNTPDWHPARDMHDSFYTTKGNVLRTHTSAFQTRAMKNFGPPPLRAMTSGRCYRRDEIDASHFPIFHQLDVIAIDENISFADLKWVLYQLASGLFGDDVQLRFRPSYFPFTTPSAEVDVMFNGKWLEILGAGMIRPEVLQAGGVDSEKWQGFAFGLGIDRMAMIRHGISDIRLMYENEEAFLRQF
ncbi:phenylalanine--tRNA ligase subunit alpha [uncultured Gimesia sp.]|jgi:phenylalanyl-tRNA synthetase alpha chain|uniref:phenylalanine--tRNA ligase subunit alpha n=1 Tax=uncultured Gimesia sp. TaxID=1678688 RepID=UPI002626CB79|nr:phenylalanine--tRNA ligase subunit alpha [uncultured Gimesia sp.]